MRRSSSAASDASGIETRFKAPDDVAAKKLVIDMVNGIGFAAIDLGSLATGGAMHEVGAQLSGTEFHFVRWLR
jgi:predicted dinucleotide-binding enzyme